MPVVDVDKLQFILREPSLGKRFSSTVIGFLYFLARSISNPRFSFRGFARISVAATAATLLALLPFWFSFLIQTPEITNITVTQLGSVSGSIVVLMLLRGIAVWDGRNSKRREESRRFTVDFANNMGHFRKAFRGHHIDPNSPEAMSAINGVLRTIADRVRMLEPQALKNPEDLEAILVLFSDDECENMRVVARSHSARRSGMILRSPDAVSYYVAMKGIHHAEQNWRQSNTPFRDTQVGADEFRSFLFIPLIDFSDGTYKVPGVVAIASTWPYLFARRAQDVRLKVDPCCTLLKTVLENHMPRLEVKGRSVKDY